MHLESSKSDYIMRCCFTKSDTNYTQIVSAHLIKSSVQIAGILMLHINQAKRKVKIKKVNVHFRVQCLLWKSSNQVRILKVVLKFTLQDTVINTVFEVATDLVMCLVRTQKFTSDFEQHWQ